MHFHDLNEAQLLFQCVTHSEQLVIDQGEQFASGTGVALFQRIEDAADIAHAASKAQISVRSNQTPNAALIRQAVIFDMNGVMVDQRSSTSTRPKSIY